MALWTYRINSRRERAKWAVQLFEKFYETDTYKVIRNELDCENDADGVKQLVTKEPGEFTDYLNFFEMVSFLADTKQLSEKDVLSLFRYYLRCLKRHPVVIEYLNKEDRDFEQLSKFLMNTTL